MLLTLALGSSLARADVLDSATVSLSCTGYTVTVAGHGLKQPDATVNYNWEVVYGGLGIGIIGSGVTDVLPVKPKGRDGTFMVSATKPEPIPPFSAAFLIGGTATLTTGR